MFNQLIENQILKNLLLLLLLIICGKLILSFLGKVIDKYLSKNKDDNPINAAKIETVSKALYSVVRFIVIFIIVIIFLDMLGINTRSIIATAGIGGIAIAFGAQSIVQDFIKGMFMILDDVIRVGDFVECAGISGTVESVGLRLTKIRDYDGSLHTVPNSQIQNIKNYNRGPQRAEIIFSVAYDTSLDEVKDICQKVSEELLAMEEFEDAFLENFSFLGVEDMQDLSYKVKATSLVKQGKQYEIKRRARELVKDEIEKRGLQAGVLELNEKIQDK